MAGWNRWCAAAIALAGCSHAAATHDDAGGHADGGAPDDGALGLAIDAGPPPDVGPGLPDLQFLADQMTNAWVVTNDLFLDASDCAVVEGCVAAPGRRTLLRFDTVTANLGTADLVMGVPPPAGESNDVFEWSPCHMHHHVRNYAKYELLDATGVILTSRKQSFCLQDNQNVTVGATAKPYSCDNQGISRGWADVYSRGLACQWIDVTDVPHGTYTLRITVNPLNIIAETDTSNNVFTTTVQF